MAPARSLEADVGVVGISGDPVSPPAGAVDGREVTDGYAFGQGFGGGPIDK